MFVYKKLLLLSLKYISIIPIPNYVTCAVCAVAPKIEPIFRKQRLNFVAHAFLSLPSQQQQQKNVIVSLMHLQYKYKYTYSTCLR